MSEQYATLIEAIAQDESGDPRFWVNLKTTHYREQVLGLSPRELGILVFEMIEWINNGHYPDSSDSIEFRRFHRRRSNIKSVLADLYKLPFIFSLNELIVLLTRAQGSGVSSAWGDWSYMIPITKAMERYLQDHPCPPELRTAVDSLLQKHTSTEYYRLYGAKLGSLVKSAEEFNFLIVCGEAWSDRALATLGSLPIEQQHLWAQLMRNILQHWGGGRGEPEATWLKSNQALITKIGIPVFQGYLLEWLPLLDQPRTQRIEAWSEVNSHVNSHILGALVWLSAAEATLPLARAVAGLAVSAFRKVSPRGVRCVWLGWAALLKIV